MLPDSAYAQHITIDGSLSPGQTLIGPNYTIGANLGKQVGGNLFQSFGIFGLASGETATFTGPASVTNIIGRVTGGSASTIDGAVKSSIAGANLFLINPFGIVFGSNATVAVGGSFHAATADWLQLADGAKFQATHPDGSTFSAAAPAAFGFLGATPAAIAVNGSSLGPVPGALSLVGGPVTLSGGTLSAAGAIHIASAAGPGLVPVDPAAAATATVATYGAVTIGGGAAIDATNGGSVSIRAGSLTLDGGQVEAANTGSFPGGTISVQVDGQLTLAGPLAGTPSAIVSTANGSGNAGTVTVTAGAIALSGIAQIGSTGSGTGSSGAVTVSTRGALTIDATGVANLATLVAGNPFAGIRSAATGTAGGNAGMVTVSAGSLGLHGGALVGTSVASGASGDVTVGIGGAAVLDTLGDIAADSPVAGTGGNVRVTATSLSLASGGAIYTDSMMQGRPGNVTVTVAGALTIDNSAGSGEYQTGILSQAFGQASTGSAGNVTVAAGSLAITNGGLIASQTQGTGIAGGIAVTVGGAVTIDGGGLAGEGTGIFTEAFGAQSACPAGPAACTPPITLAAGSLSIVDGGQIASYTKSTAPLRPTPAGDVTVTVAGLLSIDGTGAAKTQQGAISLTGIASEAELVSNSSKAPIGTGAAGNVTISAGSLSILAYGQVTTSTFGAGAAGQVQVAVAGAATIDAAGTLPNLSLTGIASNSESGATGNAGAVTFTAGSLSVLNGGQIASSLIQGSFGNADRVSVAVSGSLAIAGAGSGIGSTTTEATVGKSGTVTVSAGALSITDHGEISADTSATCKAGSDCDAGNVTVTAGTLTIADNGRIESGTFAANTGNQYAGNGGNITVSVAGQLTIDAGFILAEANPAAFGVLAVGATGTAGTVTVSASGLTIIDGGAIQTLAPLASGGDMSITAGDLLHLENSRISASVTDTVSLATGNGGDITMAAPLFVVDGSTIFAKAFKGNGGNIRLVSAEFLASDTTQISATSTLGISGTIDIVGPRVDLNGALVVLPGNLRAPSALLRSSCAARFERPQSSLFEGGRGGLPADPASSLAALYLAGRTAEPISGQAAVLPPQQAAARLAMRCGTAGDGQ